MDPIYFWFIVRLQILSKWQSSYRDKSDSLVIPCFPDRHVFLNDVISLHVLLVYTRLACRDCRNYKPMSRGKSQSITHRKVIKVARVKNYRFKYYITKMLIKLHHSTQKYPAIVCFHIKLLFTKRIFFINSFSLNLFSHITYFTRYINPMLEHSWI